MAVTIDYSTYPHVINVPRADMTLIQASPEIRELDLDVFRLELRDLEDDETGIHFPITHTHNTSVAVDAVTTVARVVLITDDYVVTFEDGMYAVNLVGANSNVAAKTVVNQVSIRSSNTAGLIVYEGATSGLTPAESATLTLILNLMRSGRILTDDGSGDVTVVLPDGGGSYTTSGWEDPAGTVPHTGGVVRRTDPLPPTLDP